MRIYILWNAALVLLMGCGSPDASFTKLSDPEPPVADTSEPPEEPAEEPAVADPPEACPDKVHAAQVTTTREDCLNEPPVTRYTPVLEWRMTEYDELPEYGGGGYRTVIGQLTDDNGDGLISEADTPDIVMTTGGVRRAFRVISGDGSLVHWSRDIWEIDGTEYSAIAEHTPALGDVDNDGEPEIVGLLGPHEIVYPTTGFWGWVDQHHTHEPVCALVVLSADGVLESAVTDIRCEAHSPAIADMDGDGMPDILVDRRVFEGDGLLELTDPLALATGARGTSTWYWTGGIMVPVDLDGDGLMEGVTGSHIQEWDGSLRCLTDSPDGWPAVADLDGDGLGELVISIDNGIRMFDRNCTFLGGWSLYDGGIGGPPTVADFDGDGIPEIGITGQQNYMVYELDGTLNWNTPATDYSSNCTGSSVFDFEEDGYAEVVYADETDLWIISGHSGSYVMRWSGQDSGTTNEYPKIVDVDGDGAAEIVHADSLGVYVIGAIEGWAPARQVWNQHAYWITNVNDDLTIPSPTPQNWPEYNSFRSGDLRVNAGQGARLVDAKPFVHDICEVECGEGTVQVALSPNNEGLADAIDGVNLAVYAEQTDGSQVLLEVLTPEDLHRAGYATEGVVLELAMTDLPTGTLILVADDDGTGTGVIEECDETNNELRLEGLCADE